MEVMMLLRFRDRGDVVSGASRLFVAPLSVR